jgi:hypothetical protein
MNFGLFPDKGPSSLIGIGDEGVDVLDEAGAFVR